MLDGTVDEDVVGIKVTVDVGIDCEVVGVEGKIVEEVVLVVGDVGVWVLVVVGFVEDF